MSGIDEKFINLLHELKIIKPRVKDTLGVPRNKMPQIAREHYDDYFAYMKKNGVTFVKQTISVQDIKATQKEFSDAGVIKSVLKGRSSKKVRRIIISSDNFIIDGHHRWLAALNISPSKQVEVVRANAKGKEVLQLTLKFEWVTFKTIYERTSMIDEGIDYLAEMTPEMKAKVNSVIATRYERQAVAAMHRLVTSKRGRHSLGHYALQIGKVYDIGNTRKFVDKYKKMFAEELKTIGGFKAKKSDKKNEKIDIPKNGRIDGYAPVGNARPMHIVRSHNIESACHETETYHTKEEQEMNTFAKIKKILSEKKLDKVDKKAVKKDFEDRKDQDLDNDGDTDSTDKYLHKRRKAISKNIDKKKKMGDDENNYYDDNNEK